MSGVSVRHFVKWIYRSWTQCCEPRMVRVLQCKYGVLQDLIWLDAARKNVRPCCYRSRTL